MVLPAAGRLVGAGTLGLVVVEVGGGTRLVWIPCLFSRVVPYISTLVRALMPFCGSTVAALNHSTKSITRWVIPIASIFACILCHTFKGDKNGATISGCARERGDSDTRGTETLSGLDVSPANLGCSGARHANAASISVFRGTSTSLGVIHSGRMMTVAGNWPSQMSQAKVRTFPSSSVVLVKDGVSKWVLQSTLMCSYGELRHTTSSGLSPKGKLMMSSSRTWRVVF